MAQTGSVSVYGSGTQAWEEGSQVFDNSMDSELALVTGSGVRYDARLPPFSYSKTGTLAYTQVGSLPLQFFQRVFPPCFFLSITGIPAATLSRATFAGFYTLNN